ncbi:MAG: hypothetical protein O7G85_08320 [Planctomycetota bacterium]|nr:hypothetical protein [Planctomycetota bacterium]
MNRSLIALGIMALLLLGFSQGDPLELQVRNLEIKQEHSNAVIISLTQRIERLEAKHSGSRGGNNEPTAPSSPKVVQIDEIRQLPIDDAKLQEAKLMEWRIQTLINEAESYEKQAIHLRSKDRKRSDGLVKMATRKKVEANKLHAKVLKMKREAIEPRHLITGWNGSTTIFLRTERNLTSVIEQTKKGGYLQWQGRTISSGANFHHVRVGMLKIVGAPEAFIRRPEDVPIPELKH